MKKSKNKILSSLLTGTLSLMGVSNAEAGDVTTKHRVQQSSEESRSFFESSELKEIHKKLRKGKKLTKEEFKILNEAKYLIDAISPNSINDNQLNQFQKDLRFFANRLNGDFAIKNLDREVEDLIKKYEGKSNLGVSFLDYIRDKQNSVYRRENTIVINYNEINSSLSREILRLSRKYDVNPRLITAICTIENNFGLQRVSSANARGMCQTKEQIVRFFYSGYDSLSEADKDWVHFEATFRYFSELKKTKNYDLDIGFNDSAFKNKKDILKAAYLYFNGETITIRNRGQIIDGSETKKYLLKILDSFNYRTFVLNYGDKKYTAEI